jgi:hypothetical protein
MYLLQDHICNYKLNNTEYNLLMLYALLGLTMLIVDDLEAIFLSIELQSLSLYLLLGLKKNSVYSIESGLKYFILGALSAGYFLLGIVFLNVLFVLIVLFIVFYFFFIFFSKKKNSRFQPLAKLKKFLESCTLFFQLTPTEVQVELTTILRAALQLLDELEPVIAVDMEVIVAAKEAIKKLYYDGGYRPSSKGSYKHLSPALLDHEYDDFLYLEKISLIREKLSHKRSALSLQNSGPAIRALSELEALDRILKVFVDSRVDKQKAHEFLYDLGNSGIIYKSQQLARRLEWSRETHELVVYLCTGFLFDCLLMAFTYLITFFPKPPKR